MASTAGTPSIASLYRICIQLFDGLSKFLQAPDCEFCDQVSLLALQDELGRFRVWAGNVGAHRNGRVSLDHRLREASQIHRKVIDLLEDLEKVLQEAIAITSHQREPFDQSSWSSDSSISSLGDASESVVEPEDEISSTTELQELFSDITHVITCLYNFSVTLRNPAPRDRLQKCASINVSHYEFFDIQHASHKFPGAEEFLINRLGKSNSRRRQLFKYHERHHNTIAHYIDLPQPAPLIQSKATSDEEQLPVKTDEDHSPQDRHPNTQKGPSTIATTVKTQTTVSTFVPGPSLPDAIEVCSDAGQSQTSFASSASASGETRSKLRVPPPPQPASDLNGNPFECPYCFSMIIVRSVQSWRKHVFRDLRPYVCTFRNCQMPDQLFESRHDWYNHEIQAHRREWLCNACRQPFTTKELFEYHVRKKHLGLFTETQLPAVADRCEKAIDSEQACPLCGGMYLPPRFQGHLARHMQQLSLFILPKKLEGVDGDGESIGAQASNSDQEKTEGSFPDSSDLDPASSSSQRSVDDISSAPNKISSTEDETQRPPTPLSEHPDPTNPPLAPEWLAAALAALQEQYPTNNFEAMMRQTVVMNALPQPGAGNTTDGGMKYKWAPKLKCHDCPEKLYPAGPDETVDDFLTHLEHRGHRMRVDNRVRLNQYKLETEFHNGYVVHKIYTTDPATEQAVAEEEWTQKNSIGAGRSGVVFLEEERGGRLRAVKNVILGPSATISRQEVSKMTRVTDHKRLFVQLFGWYEDKNYLYIAMEYIEYGNLGQFIKNGSARLEARKITAQLLEGLAVLHERQIRHSDLKPQSILVACMEPIWVKIASFGISETGTGQRGSTSRYTAPEMLGMLPGKGNKYTNAEDLWSLGCIIHEILTSGSSFLGAPLDGPSRRARMDLILKYCQGTTDFPVEPLQDSEVSEEGIKHVKSLLAADPSSRISAADGLKSLWLLES